MTFAAPKLPPPKLILASASPRRLALLAQIGVIPTKVTPSDIDETPTPSELPRIYALRMAQEKLQAIVTTTPLGAYYLSADTVVAVGRRILGKPQDADMAELFLRKLSGRRHQVLTAVAVLAPQDGGIKTRVSATTVKLARLSDAAIKDYIASGEWQGKAGGYGIQGYAARHVAWIQGSYTGVVGLPLFETSQLLAGLGYPITAPISAEQ